MTTVDYYKAIDIEIKKENRTNKVEFFQDGKQIFPTSWKGNIVSFENGKTILI